MISLRLWNFHSEFCCCLDLQVYYYPNIFQCFFFCISVRHTIRQLGNKCIVLLTEPDYDFILFFPFVSFVNSIIFIKKPGQRCPGLEEYITFLCYWLNVLTFVSSSVCIISLIVSLVSLVIFHSKTSNICRLSNHFSSLEL